MSSNKRKKEAMNSRETSSYTESDFADPGIDAATLRQVATARADLRSAILAHPNCYPELTDWLRQRIRAADEQPPAPGPTATAAPEPLEVPRRSQDPSVQPMSAGAKQLAAGAKAYFSSTVAPAAAGAARSIQSAVNERAGKPPAGANWNTWVPFIVPVAAFIAIISLFLPIGSVSVFGYSISINFFSEEAGGEGVMLLILMLAAIAFAVVSILIRKKWARITAGIVGILVGLFGMIDGFATMANMSSVHGASVGSGVVLLAIASTVLLVAAILTLLPQKRSQPAQAMQ